MTTSEHAHNKIMIESRDMIISSLIQTIRVLIETGKFGVEIDKRALLSRIADLESGMGVKR